MIVEQCFSWLIRSVKRLNAWLGRSRADGLEFHPVEIQGEPLSATVIRDRHRGVKN